MTVSRIEGTAVWTEVAARRRMKEGDRLIRSGEEYFI
jgi:hypothetical protein